MQLICAESSSRWGSAGTIVHGRDLAVTGKITQSKAFRRILNILTCLLCLQFNWVGGRIILARSNRVPPPRGSPIRGNSSRLDWVRAQVASRLPEFGGNPASFPGPLFFLVEQDYALVTRCPVSTDRHKVKHDSLGCFSVWVPSELFRAWPVLITISRVHDFSVLDLGQKKIMPSPI